MTLRLAAPAPSPRRDGAPAPARSGRGRTPGPALAAAVLTFFVITLDAVVVNVALPSVRRELGGGITGLQWVVDGYTLAVAALLLSPLTAVLLDAVPGHRAGVASGVFNTSRQVGGALAVAVFGGLVAGRGGFLAGARTSLEVAAAVAALAVGAALLLPSPRTTTAATS